MAKAKSRGVSGLDIGSLSLDYSMGAHDDMDPLILLSIDSSTPAQPHFMNSTNRSHNSAQGVMSGSNSNAHRSGRRAWR